MEPARITPRIACILPLTQPDKCLTIETAPFAIQDAAHDLQGRHWTGGPRPSERWRRDFTANTRKPDARPTLPQGFLEWPAYDGGRGPLLDDEAAALHDGVRGL